MAPDRIQIAKDVIGILKATAEAAITSKLKNIGIDVQLATRLPEDLFAVNRSAGINVSVGRGPSVPYSMGKEEHTQFILVQCYIRGTRPETDHIDIVHMGEAVERDLKLGAHQILPVSAAKFQMCPDFDVDDPYPKGSHYLHIVTVIGQYWKTH